MSEENWEVIDEVAGDLQAEMLRGLLEAQGIHVWLSQEGAGKAIGLTLPMLGMVQILVPTHEVDRARAILETYYSGELEEMELDSDAVHRLEAEEEDQEE